MGKLSLLERLNENTIPEPNSGCWLWTGSTIRQGYGNLWKGPRSGQNILAHRAAYELFVGPIPEGMFVCHKCDVPSCVNPDHLFLGTNADNMVDMVQKGRGWNPRGAMTVCIRGHALEGKNLKVKSDGARRCLACLRKYEKERSRKRRARHE